MGWDEVGLPALICEGDTFYSQSEVLEKRESKCGTHQGHEEMNRIIDRVRGPDKEHDVRDLLPEA
jgi:hypothetical protein